MNLEKVFLFSYISIFLFNLKYLSIHLYIKICSQFKGSKKAKIKQWYLIYFPKFSNSKGIQKIWTIRSIHLRRTRGGGVGEFRTFKSFILSRKSTLYWMIMTYRAHSMYGCTDLFSKIHKNVRNWESVHPYITILRILGFLKICPWDF